MALTLSSMMSPKFSRDRKARMSKSPLPMQHRRLMYLRTILRSRQSLTYKTF